MLTHETDHDGSSGVRVNKAVFYDSYLDPWNYQRVEARFVDGRFVVSENYAGVGGPTESLRKLRSLVERVAKELEDKTDG